MNSHGAPAFVVYRRYLGAIGSLLAALAVALSAYAMHAAAPEAQARLLQAAVFAFAHGVALTALWGAADELHQKFVPGRSSDVADFAADLLGALVAAAAVLLLSRAPLVRRLLAPRAARTE